MNKTKAIIIDIDNTIALEKKVKPLPTNNDREAWDKYHAEMNFYDNSLHVPIKEIIDLISYFLNFNYDEVEVLFLTAREDTECGLIKENTEKFIKTSFPLLQQQDFKLLMRPENDFRPSNQVKEQILKEEILPLYNVIMAFDDDENNIKMFIDNGITALQVYSKDYYNFIKEDRGC